MMQEDLLFVISQEKIKSLEQEYYVQSFGVISCAKCNYQFSFEKGGNANLKDQSGKLLPVDLQTHYSENRFVCPQCKTEQCKSCKKIPYHLGYNCDSFNNFLKARHCRFCDKQIQKIDETKPQALQDLCEEPDCIERSTLVCTKILPCGHSCCGLKNETTCPPCFLEKCKEKNQLQQQGEDDYCNICFVESLKSSPCVRFGCGHYFHYQCIKKRLSLKWPSARIIFNFCVCPLCKAWIELPSSCDLNQMQQENLTLFEKIRSMSVERLKFEERLKDQKLNDPKSPFFNKPEEYSLAIYAYYQCFKCKSPYFGGLKDCMRGLEDEKGNFKPEELVCAKCCEIPVDDCKKHGKDFIEFKCRFCCSVAQCFCWGSTHFCEPCHKRQCEGDYVSKYAKDKLPKCSGKDQCPLKIDHKPNGEECALGCSLCRNIKENDKNF
eukprot:TRINITY_DN4898_c0_g1_i1.p1 TRINITY_DN4898_c0_g1~~TRINITY_DN4898_c0_g1_i1.p1  ORF type:complete len:436 (-),score=56.00 TRINITY_DN4898_c0_g1_i1:71-1378(-)